jgi:hypothetical protein
VNEVTPDLNVGTVYNGKFRPDFFDEGNKSGHLGIIYYSPESAGVRTGRRLRTDESDVNATRSKRATLSCPPETVLENPRVKVILGFLGKSEIRRSNSLKNVVVVLGRAEHAWGRVRHIPVKMVSVKKRYVGDVTTDQAASTSKAVRNLIKAWRIYRMNDEGPQVLSREDSRVQHHL